MQNKKYRLIEDLLGERWVSVVDWEQSHMVSSKGRVKTIGRKFTKSDGRITFLRPKILKQHINAEGYYALSLRYNDKSTTTRVHVLMLKSFIDQDYAKKGLVGNHKDGNKLNNDLDNNLEITTYSGNISHAYENGLRKVGESHYRAKLSNAQVNDIRNLKIKRGGRKEVAKFYGVSVTTINDIVNYKKRKNG